MSARSPVADGLQLVGGYARQQPGTFAIAVAGSVVYAAGSVASAWALGWATDEVLVPLYDGATTAHWAAAALLIGVMIVRAGGVIVRRYFAGMTAARIRSSLQGDLAERYVRMPVDRLRARPAGELLAGIDADTEAAIDVIHPSPFTIGVVSMIVFAVVQLGTIDMPLMLATVGVLPLVLLASVMTTFALEKPTEREREANAAVTAATAEIIAGTQVIKTLGREDAELERFATITDELRARRVRIAIMKSAIDFGFQLLPQLAMILIIVVGVSRVEAGALGPGDLVQAVALFGVLAFPMQVIGFFLTDLPVSVVGRRRIDLLRDEPDDPLTVLFGDGQLPDGPLTAALEGVGVGDGPTARLDQLDLTLDAGETLAVVGPTAGGKSTLVEALARLRPVDRGSVSYSGAGASTVADAELRRRVTVAAQTAILFSGTIRENVDYGRGFSIDEIDTALTIAGAGALTHELPDGFETVVGERGIALSGGQRQRIALARALAGEPGLIILDDATSAIDPGIEEDILAALAALPTTVVMVTHRVAAMAAADRVAMIAEGRLVGLGTHDALLADAGYRRLVEAYQAEEALQ